MTLQAIGNGARSVGNALVPKFEGSRIPSAAAITVGVALAALGIVSIVYASSGVALPAKLFKAGWTVADAMKYSIITTAVGGGLMVAPCIVNAGAKGIREYRETYVFSGARASTIRSETEESSSDSARGATDDSSGDYTDASSSESE